MATFQAGLLSRQPLEPRAVVGRGRGELVEDLAEPVRAGVGHGLRAPRRSPRTAPRRQQIRSGWSSIATIASFTSFASTFLPRYSGVRPTIRPARNTATMMYISMFSNPAPIPLKTTLSIIIAIGTSPAIGLRLSCMLLTEPLDVAVVIAAQVADGDRPEPDLLALHVRPRGRPAGPSVAALGSTSARIGDDGPGDAGTRASRRRSPSRAACS